MDPSTVEWFRELHEKAHRTRRCTRADGETRLASEELTLALWHEITINGRGIAEMAAILRVTYAAVRNRLGRYGLGPLPPSQAHTFIRSLA